MPSIRYLAKQLRVSVITTKRAYDDLEAEGFLETTPGKGTYVSLAGRDRLREVAMSQIEGKLSEIIDAGKVDRPDARRALGDHGHAVQGGTIGWIRTSLRSPD